MNILFLFDAENFGGHEITALAAIEGLVADQRFTVAALHTSRNQRLVESLNSLTLSYREFQVYSVPARECFSESFDALLKGARTKSIARAIQRLNPDFAVNVQGFITIGLCCTEACRSLHLPIVSFIPMAHKLSLLHPSMTSFCHDLANRYWYSRPSAFLTTSMRMKNILVHEHSVDENNVMVAEYGPKISTETKVDKKSSRAALGLSHEFHIGIIGRVEFVQKRQDFLIRSVAKYSRELQGIRFAIIGGGPDLDEALQLVKIHDVRHLFHFMPWQENMRDIYSALDALLIPSRYEGVPLVMMEAMLHRVPVLASDVDGMRDILPRECLFREGDAIDMIQKIKLLPTSVTSQNLDHLAGLITNKYNTTEFCKSFASALLHLHGNPVRH